MFALKRLHTTAVLPLLPLLILAVVLISLQPLIPPRVVEESASPEIFSAERAAEHLREISREPHPTGTPAHARVRDYIVKQLALLGLQPQLQRELATAPSYLPLPLQGVVAGMVENIVVRMEGTAGGPALLLMAHYDTVPNAPGASDDGHAVAVLLETARALLASPSPPRNDIIFLFTDGEEVGLLGAKAFVEKHPWARDVAVVLNFEARGTGGPVAMFETGDGNRKIISAFAAGAPRPLAYSLVYDLYKQLPNDTDLSVFKKAGYQGLNFAYAHHPQNYHTALDSMENIDLRSLQHTGSYALALAGHFGGMDLRTLESDADAVYFTLLPSVQVRYPQGWSLPLTLAVLILLAAALAAGLWRRALNPGRVLLACFLFPGTLVLVAAAVNLFWRLVVLLTPDPMVLFSPAYNIYLLLGLLAFTAAVFSCLYLLIRRIIAPADLIAGVLLFWAFPVVLTLIFLPGGHYLFAWPLLFAAAGLLFIFLDGQRELLLSRADTAARFTLFIIPALLLVVPVLAILYILLSLSLPEALAVLFALLLGLFIPWLTLPAGKMKWATPLAAAVLTLLLIGGGLINAVANPFQPRFSSIILAHDADSGESRWISLDGQTDDFSSRFIPEPRFAPQDQFFPAVSSERICGPAPALALEGPEAVLVAEAVTSRGRVLTVSVRAPEGTGMLELYLLDNTGVNAVEVNGEAVLDFIPAPGGASRDTAAGPYRHWTLRFVAPPEEGIDLTLHLDSTDPLTARLLSYSFALPSLPGYDYARPEGMVPSPESDFTIVTRAYTF